jgi:murein DD-endopeptidase MepM/ murein hydrolase activator NlpD
MAIKIYPIAGAPRNICAGYGYRTYANGSVKLHDACDLCAPIGTPDVAVDDGEVSWGTDPIGGNVAVLRTADSLGYYYAHLLDTQSGKRAVQAGDQIGRVGMTGNAQGTIPHTHFQVWPGGQFGPAGTVHPDPTADLLAAEVLSSPGGIVVSSASNLALAALGGATILGAAALGAWAITENKHHAAAYARENPTTASRCPTGSHVQSLLFPRDKYTTAQARRWVKSHGYRSGKTSVEGRFIHVRQEPSAKFARIRTVPFGRGIVARVGWVRC